VRPIPWAQATVIVLAVCVGSAPPAAQQPRPADDIGLRGSVTTHEDAPVSSGTVALQSAESSSVINASIDREGHFRAVTTASGMHWLTITVPGFAPHRVNVIVPASRRVTLPPIQLPVPTYFRAQFVNANGDIIVSPRLRGRSQDAGDVRLLVFDSQGLTQIESDGSIVVGPLRRGLTTLALDMPMLAQTRLPDITIDGTDDVIDGGVITIQPGSVFHVDVVDGTGAPIANHLVSIEDVLPFSALSFQPARTDRQGRATFDRLAAGRYRVRTVATERCNGVLLSTARLVSVNGNGLVGLRLVIGGSASLRVTSPLGSLAGIPVSIAPDSGEPLAAAPFAVLPGRPPAPLMRPPSCGGSTDADGRVTFANVPPGAARIDVRLRTSTHLRRANVRGDGPEIAIAIPDGYLPLHVTSETTGRPIANAMVTWNGGGYRVQAATTGNGDVLLEGVGDGVGSISVAASGFVTGEATVTEATATTHEVALRPSPRPRRQVRVVSETGEPVANAIVELLPATVLDVGVIAVSDAKGAVVFSQAPQGTFRAIVSADGFAPAAISLAGDTDTPVVVTLARER